MKISNNIRQDIITGKFANDGKLPGVRQLAEYYQCSSGTIVNALKELAADGTVRTEHGRGTFLAGQQSVKRPAGRIIGAVLLWNSYFEAMEELRDEYLKQGWFVSLYCSSRDLQNPAAEKHFLELAYKQNFAGVIITGTPKIPLNSGFYQALRCSGMKIIHLTNYKTDMTGEAAILPDFRTAGVLACSAAAVKGKKSVLIITSAGYEPPSSILRAGGVRTAAKAWKMELLPELKLNSTHPEIPPELLDKLYRMCINGDSPALLAQGCPELLYVYDILRQIGVPEAQLPFGIAMSDTSKLRSRVNHIAFDYRQMIQMAMDYIIDENISPLDHFVRIADPQLIISDNDSSLKHFNFERKKQKCV